MIIRIGIDPDVDKSGVAIIESNKLFTIKKTLIELFYLFEQQKENIAEVRIEAGWLTSNNFNANGATEAARQKAANHIGANLQIGKEIEKKCIELNIKYKLIKPLKKVWGKDAKGKNKKISHEQILSLWQVKRLGYNENKSSQEERDAILIAIL